MRNKVLAGSDIDNVKNAVEAVTFFSQLQQAEVSPLQTKGQIHVFVCLLCGPRQKCWTFICPNMVWLSLL